MLGPQTTPKTKEHLATKLKVMQKVNDSYVQKNRELVLKNNAMKETCKLKVDSFLARINVIDSNPLKQKSSLLETCATLGKMQRFDEVAQNAITKQRQTDLETALKDKTAELLQQSNAHATKIQKMKMILRSNEEKLAERNKTITNLQRQLHESKAILFQVLNDKSPLGTVQGTLF